MIPLIHAIWLGGELPHFAQRFLSTWRQHHPDWELRLWTSPDEFPMRHRMFVDKAERFVPRASIPQFISDLMRYEILERDGGLYVDCDMECRRPFGDLLGSECFASWEVQDVWVGNAILGAQPGALFLQRLLDGLPHSVESNRGKRPNRSTGPQFLTKTYNGHHDEIDVLPQEWCYPVPWSRFEASTDDHPDAWCVHHWNNQRTKAGVPL